MSYFLHFFFPNALSEYQDRLPARCWQTPHDGADCNTGAATAGIHRIIRSFATCTRRARRTGLPPVTETGLHWWLMLGKFSTTTAAEAGTIMFLSVRGGQKVRGAWVSEKFEQKTYVINFTSLLSYIMIFLFWGAFVSNGLRKPCHTTCMNSVARLYDPMTYGLFG